MNIPSEQELNKQYDRVVRDVFLGKKNTAFLGSILCSVEFLWDRKPGVTAWTDGLKMGWSPKDFLECSTNTRISTLLHELWHVGKMHRLRRGSRDPKIWNIACDYRINNDLRYDGFTVPDTWVVDPSIDTKGILAEEEIYDLLIKGAIPIPANAVGDLVIEGDINPTTMISAVVRAIQAAEMAGKAGELPGGLRQTLDTFLKPVVPWNQVLQQWMTDLTEDPELTWKRRNRRYQDIYMPSRQSEENRLEHLAYIEDVSGSITKNNKVRFNSEVKYVWEVLQPKKLTLIQFDTEIQNVRVYNEGDNFNHVEMFGGGGTNLVPVREWIEKNEPTAAIIFSDLECDPMEPLTKDIPIIWAVVRNKNMTIPFGKMIFVTD